LKVGTNILKGITTGLLVTILTLLAVLGATITGIEKQIVSYIVDFGLLLSCLAAGYRASSNSGRILPAGLASGGYAIVGVLLLALYFPINTLGAVKIVSEGTGLGLLAGVLGAGILSPNSPPYEYMEATPYPRRKKHDEKREFYDLDGERGPDRTEIAAYAGEPEAYGNEGDPERTRAKIYEICHSRTAETDDAGEEDDVFQWWNVEAKKQLRNR
jgi:hypothetical protein